MRKMDLPRGEDDFGGQRRFPRRKLGKRLGDPFLDIHLQFDAAFFYKDHAFPDADRRKPFLIGRVLQRLGNSWRKSCRFEETPDPNVSIEEEFHAL